MRIWYVRAAQARHKLRCSHTQSRNLDFLAPLDLSAADGRLNEDFAYMRYSRWSVQMARLCWNCYSN